MKKLRLAVITDGFSNWAGGRDFILSILYALSKKKHSSQFEIYLFHHQKFLYRPFLSELKFVSKFLWKKIRGKKKTPFGLEIIKNKNSYREFFLRMSGLVENENIFIYKSNKKLRKKLKEFSIDTALPVFQGLKIDIPGISYYPDLQHKYFPEFFSEKERRERDLAIQNLLLEKKAILTPSLFVKNDLNKFFKNEHCQIFGLPITPIILEPSWLDELPFDIFKKYNLPEKYFVISNQFWIHKSHLTAFEALHKLILENKNFSDVKIVCTGSTSDYRFPGYFADLQSKIKEMNLEDKIVFLGLVPKRDQIEIIKKSTALIQPTLFEGSIGGLSLYDALCVGTPAIISDIEVNLEAKDQKNIFFFKAKDAESLKEKMNYVLSSKLNRPSKAELLKSSDEAVEKLGNILMKAVETVLSL